MSKLITCFLVILIGQSLLSSVLAGGGGVVTTRLRADITAEAVVLPVDSTEGYLDADYVIIGNEKILHTGTTDAPAASFTGCTRGYGGTDAESHEDNAIVYTADASTLNSAMGFSVAATADSMGTWAVLTIPWNFITKTIPHMVMVNFAFLDTGLAMLTYFNMAMGAGLIITLALSLAGGRRV